MNKYTQTKPARSIGGDITQSTLQTTLDKAGIDRSITQLSYAEKRLVIITTLLGQLKNATDDWGKTLDSPANQTRILSEQWERLTRALGNIFLPIVYKILPYVNGILMVLTEIAKIIGNIMAKIFGFKPEDLDFGSGVGQDLDIFGEKADNATAKTEKLKKSVMGLRSFDKIINISTPKNDGSGAGAGATGISSDILNMANKAMDSYNKKLKNVKLQATEIRDKIMEWLGFTKIVDEKTREVSFKFDHITKGTVLGGLAVGGIIYKGISKIFKILSKLGLIKLPKLSSLAAPLSKIVQLASKLKGLSFAKLATGSLIIGGIIFSAKTLQKTYKENEEFRKKVDQVKTSIENFGKKLLEIWEKLRPILEKVGEIFKKVGKVVWDVMKKVGSVIEEILENVVIRTFTMAIDKISGLLDIFVLLVDGDFKGAFKRLGKMVEDLWNDWKTAFGNILNLIKELPNKFAYWVGKAIGTIINAIVSTNWIELGGKILGGILKGLFDIGQKIADFAVKVFNKIKESVNNLFSGKKNWGQIGSDIVKGIVNGMKNAITNNIFADFVKNFYKGLRSALKDSKLSKGIDVGVNFLSSAKDVASGILSFVFKQNGGVYSGGKWHDIQRYDGGGMPNSGQLFWARENGLPEMVGTIGNHTAVMNNNQIVSSVASGVYSAVLSANAQSKSNNNNQIFNIYLDKNKKLVTYTLSELQSMAKSNGKPIEIG